MRGLGVGVVFALLALLALSGCASVDAHSERRYSEKGDSKKVYKASFCGGTVEDSCKIARYVSAPFDSDEPRWWIVFATPLPLIDLPLSVVFDVVFLPSDVYVVCRHPSTESADSKKVEKPEEGSSSTP